MSVHYVVAYEKSHAVLDRFANGWHADADTALNVYSHRREASDQTPVAVLGDLLSNGNRAPTSPRLPARSARDELVRPGVVLLVVWAGETAYHRHHRRVGAIVGDAWRVERGFLRALPDPPPTTERHGEARITRDGFVRVGDVDHSVRPGLVGRRVQIRSSLTEVLVPSL